MQESILTDIDQDVKERINYLLKLPTPKQGFAP